MRRIEQEVTNQDRHIKKQAQKVKKALRETVELEGLHQKIMGKYLRFLQQKSPARLTRKTHSLKTQHLTKTQGLTPSATDLSLSKCQLMVDKEV